MLYSNRGDIGILILRKAKPVLIGFVIAIAVFVLGICSVSFAFDADVTVRLSAECVIPDEADSNYDGIPDAWCTQYGLDPNDPDMWADDNDNDGLNNKEEYLMGTSPIVSNSGITATLSASPSSGSQGTKGLGVTLTAAYSGNTYPIIRYEWDFDGNGTYDAWSYASEGNSINYKYTASGTYNAKLRVTDSQGNVGIGTQTITVTQSANSPQADTNSEDFIGTTLTIPSTETFIGTDTSATTIARYQWDLTGNGEYEFNSTESGTITKTFDETRSQSFYAHFKITNTYGLSDIDTVPIQIDASGWQGLYYQPVVTVDQSILYITAGQTVSLGGEGAPLMGNSYGYAKKYEWDFEGDGIYDWTSEVSNPGWTGRADVTHVYGAPGIYRAVLRVYTDANVCATGRVLIVVSKATAAPPHAEASVTYNSTSGTEIDYTVPIRAEFDHSASYANSGTISKFEWDFDGDKRIDFTTTSSSTKPIYNYQYPGYYLAMLRVTDTNGLIDTFYIPVFAYYPTAGHTSYIEMPFENAKVYGNAVTLVSNVFPDDATVSKVTFQYRSPGGSWNTIGDGTPITSYMISWNTTSLSGQYELRAVVNNDYTDSSGNYKVTTIEVDSADPDIEENVNGNIHTKEVNVFSNMDNEITLPDGTHLDIPEGAISADADVKIEQTLDAGIGEIMLNITGIDQFLKDITISIAYPDADNNGIVDGTSIDETTLYVQWYNESTGQWERAYDSVVYPVENFVSANINHLTGFGYTGLILGAAAAGAGGGSASSGTTASYCFIATASYGTPMADDVIILREFRDKYLMRNNIGREFVWHYYRLSPPVADFIKDKPILKMIVRFLLKPVVKIAKIMAG